MEDRVEFNCQYKNCKERFYFLSDLDDHKACHIMKNFYCSLCNKKYLREKALKKHKENKHTEKTFNSCNFCEHSTSCRNNFIKHLNIVHSYPIEEDETTIVECYCPGCRLKNKIDLYQCSICDKFYMSKSLMKKHKQRMHFKNEKKTKKKEEAEGSSGSVAGQILNDTEFLQSNPDIGELENLPYIITDVNGQLTIHKVGV